MPGTKGQRPSTWALMVCSVAATIACDSPRTAVLPFAPTSTAPPVSNSPPPSPPPPSSPPPPEGGRFTPWHGPGPDLGDALPIGHTQGVVGRVEPSDPACFVNWDQTGRCQHFELRAAETGDLEVSLIHTPPKTFEMTLFIVTRMARGCLARAPRYSERACASRPA
jgi:hypothetical protein